jgi:hypothetical protein
MKFNFLFVAFITFSILSCEEEGDLSSLSTAEVQEVMKESSITANQIFVLAQDVLDATSGVLSEEGIAIERPAGSPANCSPALVREYIQDLSHYDTAIYAGTIIMDYGNGSTCENPNAVKKGKIEDFFTYIINYRDAITFSVKQTVTFTDFVRDSLKYDGTLKLTAETGSPDTLKTQGSKITYKDGSSIKWNGVLIYDPSDPEAVNGNRKISGNIYSSSNEGNPFTATIITPLRYQFCAGENSLTPVAGRIEIKVNQYTSIVDYGDGECDRLFTITVKGNTAQFNF